MNPLFTIGRKPKQPYVISHTNIHLHRNGVFYMTDTITTAPESIGLSPNITPESPNLIPGWHKCLACSDYGVSCNGPSLSSLGDIASVRAFHKAMKKARKLTLKPIVKAAPTISEATIGEYFSNAVKDYKWTTVVAIDTALICVCGNRESGMPISSTCPASSSEMRSQLAAMELKVAAAELKAVQYETDTTGMVQKLADTKAKHIAQLAAMEADHAKDMDWMKNEVKLWRRFAFVLLAVCLVLLASLLITAVCFILSIRG